MGKWPGPILSYYLGQASANALLATAAGATDPAAKTQWTCEANFYIGREKIESNDTAEALPLSRSAAASCPMEADVEGVIGAGRHERSGDRTTWRNGYRERALDEIIKVRVGANDYFAFQEEAERQGLPLSLWALLILKRALAAERKAGASDDSGRIKYRNPLSTD